MATNRTKRWWLAALLAMAIAASCAQWPSTPLRPGNDGSVAKDATADVAADALDATDDWEGGADGGDATETTVKDADDAPETPEDGDVPDGDVSGDIDDTVDVEDGDVVDVVVTCAHGEVRCGDDCVDLQSSAAHCGACGNACALPNTMPTCAGGTCVATSCTSGYRDCDGDATSGCETDVRTTTGHCGACGNACPVRDHASATCADGSCGIRCDDGYSDCDHDPTNGCEASLALPTSCGSCATTCSGKTPLCMVSGGVTTCVSGCATGQSRCGMACVNTQTSIAHCGACGRACPVPMGASATCEMGVCGFACATGRADCDRDASNGCEVDTTTSASNCGRCGNACALPNAAPTCTAGACVTNRCNAGYGDCDGVTGNGCETDLRTTTGHCGACGASCNLPNAVPACVSGSCRVTSCVLGYGDCDGTAGNGCETDVRSAVAHCGRCGNACSTPANGRANCSSSSCGIVCNVGYANCGSVCVDLQSNTSHCGTCGHACGTGEFCMHGRCGSLVQRSCLGTPLPRGCGLVTIPGGTFTMGSNVNCSTASSDPSCVLFGSPAMASVLVRNFAMDAYEVTVARFNAYWNVRAVAMAMVRSSPIAYCGGSITWQPPPNTEPRRQDGSCNWLPTTSVRDGHPMNCVDYWMAQEFCVWDGGRLPTEVEWEYAARGSARAGLSAGRVYPWGDAAPSTTCDRAQWNLCRGDDGGATRRVGMFPMGVSGGIYDLAGNVFEWTADNYGAYSNTGSADSCANRAGTTCALCNLSGTSGRVIRGGSWDFGGIRYLRSASRGSGYMPAWRYDYVGFRCARDVP